MIEDVSPKRLAELLNKERSHDDYLYALKGIRARAAKVARLAAEGKNGFGRPLPEVPVSSYHEENVLAGAAWGYQRALTDMALLIVNASRQRLDDEERPEPPDAAFGASPTGRTK